MDVVLSSCTWVLPAIVTVFVVVASLVWLSRKQSIGNNEEDADDQDSPRRSNSFVAVRQLLRDQQKEKRSNPSKDNHVRWVPGDITGPNKDSASEVKADQPATTQKRILKPKDAALARAANAAAATKNSKTSKQPSPEENTLDAAVSKDLQVEMTGETFIDNQTSEIVMYGNGTAVSPVTVPFKSVERVLRWEAGHDPFNVAASRAPRLRYHNELKSRLLVCHDMMGGYVQDHHPQGESTSDIYRIYHWHIIDIFVYFSHNLVTIPPPVWTNCAHSNGVQVLGTVITEWKEGAENCTRFLASRETSRAFADKLVNMAVYYGFDGWLINIENPIDPAKIPVLCDFVDYLTRTMHSKKAKSLVIWYDSVTETGQLKWQNELNRSNKLFFDKCDGIFLNYHYNEMGLQRSLALARNRAGDVFAGIDVFGRGTYGGGKWNCVKAVEAIKNSNLSIALFAPGWVYENHDHSEFESHQREFWRRLLTQCSTRRIAKLPFVTAFNRGMGSFYALNGSVTSMLPWGRLSEQHLLPTLEFQETLNPYFIDRQAKEVFHNLSLGYDGKSAYNGGSCLQVKGKVNVANNFQWTCQYPPQFVYRLYETQLHLSGPTIVSVTFQAPPSTDMEFSMVLRLHSPSSAVNYLVLVNPLSEGPTATDDKQKRLEEKLREKYGLEASPLQEMGHSYTYAWPVKVPNATESNSYLNKRSLRAEGTTGKWTTLHYVLCSHSLLNKQISEIRLRGSIDPASPGPARKKDFEIKLGQLRIYSASSLLTMLKKVDNLRCGVVIWGGSKTSATNVSTSLHWSPPNVGCEPVSWYDIYHVRRNAPLILVGRAFTNAYQIFKYMLPVDDSPSVASKGEIIFAVVPCSASGHCPPIDDASKVAINWKG